MRPLRSTARPRLALLVLAIVALVTGSAGVGCSSDGIEVPLYPMPFKADQGRLFVFDGNKYDPIFIKGMNLGIALPGTQPGELSATSEDYDRWFQMLSDMGVNTIRVYTLHFPRFYQRLRLWNVRHMDRPLYVFHGIWLDEENPTKNLADMVSHYDENIVESIECVHGHNYVYERKGRAHGEFDADISPWVMGWLVGREVFPDEVETTNAAPGGRDHYDGALISLPKGTETEVWWAERVDKIAVYEREHYGITRPISVSSWPTLDPLHHPTEGKGADEDTEQLDLANLDTTKYQAGYFASYHAYPYYPDFMNEDPGYTSVRDAQGPNSYFGYLQKLRAHYYPKPLVIAEVGVPSSWGNAHFSQSGMSHGGQDEIEQGKDDVRVFQNAYDAQTGGAILFAWIDEWWKRTWIVDELAMPRDRYKLWHNVTSPEQNFGVLGFEPAPPDYGVFPDTAGKGRVRHVRGATNAEYFWVKIELGAPLAAGEKLCVGYDTYADDRGETTLPNGRRTTQRSEFALTITGAAPEAELAVMEPYDQFGVWHDTQSAWHNKTVSSLPSGRPYRSIATDGGKWNLVRWKNNGEHGSDDGVYRFPATVQDIGKLRTRNAAEQESGRHAVVFDGSVITIRIPWTLLNVTDPSDLRVLDDDPTTRDRETVVTDGFRLAVSLGDELVETSRLKWQRWDTTPVYKERRKIAYDIFAQGLRGIPER